MVTIEVGVRDIVELTCRKGDLTNERFSNVPLVEGTKAHQVVQKKYGIHDQKEVVISGAIATEDVTFILSGRMDGLLERDGEKIIEEIKSTLGDVSNISTGLREEHEAQLILYAHLYMIKHDLMNIKARLTYIHIQHHDTKSIDYDFELEDTLDYVKQILEKYLAWQRLIQARYEARQRSIQSLNFPYEEYRIGQRSFMRDVYHTLEEKAMLYAIAPTGVGKTLAVLFSALKTMKEPVAKLFYLTATSAGKMIALETFALLLKTGLKAFAIDIIAKEKICFQNEGKCDTDTCLYAKGFFDRLDEATLDVLHKEHLVDHNVLTRVAQKHSVCPFEFSLHLSHFADLIIGDYNYAFCPRARLIRHFDSSPYHPVLLVDEAHNLVSRSKEMYSASVDLESLSKVKRLCKGLKPTATTDIKRLKTVFESYPNQGFQAKKEMDPVFLEAVRKLLAKLEKILTEHPTFEARNDLIETYFEWFHFLRIEGYWHEDYAFTIEHQDDNITITLRCLDASRQLLEILRHDAYGAVFFSATLYPITYYKQFISAGHGRDIALPSPFPQERLHVAVMDQISTKYKDRQASIAQIATIICEVTAQKTGNYIVFFPSYAYLKLAETALQTMTSMHLIIQERNMNAEAREACLAQFRTKSETTNCALFVMGGMFSEGIDYVGDMCHGVIIVGVGLPMINPYNQLLKKHYEKKFNEGFNMAYTYPGFNKVVQAVGRVIRNDTDAGIAVLIDDRFTTKTYIELWPPAWSHAKVVRDLQMATRAIKTFWDELEE